MTVGAFSSIFCGSSSLHSATKSVAVIFSRSLLVYFHWRLCENMATFARALLCTLFLRVRAGEEGRRKSFGAEFIANENVSGEMVR